MSRDFKGKNSIVSSHSLYYWRSKFVNTAYPEGSMGPIMVKDYNFAERQHYGLLDPNGDPVIPREDKMVRISNSNNPLNVNYTFRSSRGIRISLLL